MKSIGKIHSVEQRFRRRRGHLGLPRLLLGFALLTQSVTVLAVNFERGRLLYENQCQACNTRMLHTPETRKIKNLTELQYMVSAWGIHSGEDWGPEEVNDVTLYLDRSFYHFGEYTR